MTEFAPNTGIDADGSVIHGGDNELFVEFYHNAEYDADFIRIQSPGDKLMITDTQATQDHKLRFARQWEAYQKGAAQFGSETPLEELPFINTGLRRQLNAIGVFTAENLANISDENASRFMGAETFRDKAKKVVEQKAKAAQFDAQDAKIAELQAQIEALQGGQQIPAKRGPGRPRKDA